MPILPKRARSNNRETGAGRTNPMTELSQKTETVLDKFRRRVLGKCETDISDDEKDSQGSDNPAKSNALVAKIV